jgi:hypothetical protein
MVSRFVVQRQNDGKYCVWDHQTRAVANLDSRYENLEFNQAIDAAIELNGSGRVAAPTPGPPQQVAQQQQQQQSKKNGK